MDRPEPGLIKWSPNAALDCFLHINLQHRVIQVYEPTGHAQRGRFHWKKVSKHDDFPPLTTCDWSPSIPGLLAVGTATGVVNLLRIDESSNAYMELNLKMSRTCQAVAFNTAGKLAVGLDRVRSDNCLYIWDVNRLATMDSASSGFPTDALPFTDPMDRLEPSVSVSSVRFFENDPNVLVAGIKGQGLRIHDLRDKHAAVITFQTKCCNNLAIDYADQNYFASSALDQPGIMVWDRRALSRSKSSVSYLEAVDNDDVPWGGSLRLNRAMQMETDPALMDSKNSFIRSLKFCRDHPGMLAVLSRTGQLKILSTKHESADTDMIPEGSPELLEVVKSHDMDPLYSDPSRKNDKIVSFDWVTLSSRALRPRLLVLRANGAFDVLEKPPATSDYLYDLIPWKPPHRGLSEGGRYHDLMEFDKSQSPNMLAPLFVENALSDIPLFGPDKADVEALVKSALQMSTRDGSLVVDEAVRQMPALDLKGASSISEKLQALKLYSQAHLPQVGASQDADTKKQPKKQAGDEPPSPRECHERFLEDRMHSLGLPREGHAILDNIMLLRAREMYLFNCATNRKIVADDESLQDVWAWVAGAEEAAAEGAMMSHPLDISYMGVYSIWTHDLGSKPERRLSGGASEPDANGWEGCLNATCKKLGVPKFETVETKRPHHRQLCLEMCNWGRGSDPDNKDGVGQGGNQDKGAAWHTMTAAQALFRGDAAQAVQVLKRASTKHPELLFVSLALQLIGKGDEDSSKGALDFDERVASKTDPYLRAISSIIATGDWANIANQKSLPLRDRIFVAVRNLADDALTVWLEREVSRAVSTGDIGAVVLTGITGPLVDILARYVQKFNDYQTATLLLSFCAPRLIDDIRATAFRNAYRDYLQRHKAFLLRARFNAESTRRSKHDGRPTIRPPPRQIALRCVYCDAETSLSRNPQQLQQLQRGGSGSPLAAGQAAAPGAPSENPLTSKMVGGGISCHNCKRHLPRCAICLEVVGMPRSGGLDKSSGNSNSNSGMGGNNHNSHNGDDKSGLGPAARFATFCLRCEHVLHLDHARLWFARHRECPVPECRCECNFRANPELNYN